MSALAMGQWNDNGTLWTLDKVGIGTSSPSYRFDVIDGVGSPAMRSQSTKNQGTAILGQCSGNSGTGVVAKSTSTTGNTVGLQAWVESATGKAVWAYSNASSGTNYSVYGQNNSPDGYSGYFIGGDFFYGGGGFMGIGRNWQINNTEAIGVYKNTTGWGGMYMGTNGGGLPYYGYATAGIGHAYHYYDSSSAQWRLSIGGTKLVVASNGYVGIGTLSPAYQLHLTGSAGKPGGGSWSNTSDRRLKKDIAPIDNALQRLLTVRGVTFEYKDPAAIDELPGRQLGVIAQDVEREFPGWVDEMDDGFKRVTYRGFEGVAIEALRELDTRNSQLQEQLEVVTSENARLADDLAALTARLAALEAAWFAPSSWAARDATPDDPR